MFTEFLIEGLRTNTMFGCGWSHYYNRQVMAFINYNTCINICVRICASRFSESCTACLCFNNDHCEINTIVHCVSLLIAISNDRRRWRLTILTVTSITRVYHVVIDEWYDFGFFFSWKFQHKKTKNNGHLVPVQYVFFFIYSIVFI